jgi:hypothetical protein
MLDTPSPMHAFAFAAQLKFLTPRTGSKFFDRRESMALPTSSIHGTDRIAPGRGDILAPPALLYIFLSQVLKNISIAALV